MHVQHPSEGYLRLGDSRLRFKCRQFTYLEIFKFNALCSIFTCFNVGLLEEPKGILLSLDWRPAGIPLIDVYLENDYLCINPHTLGRLRTRAARPWIERKDQLYAKRFVLIRSVEWHVDLLKP